MMTRDLFERVGGFDESFPVCEDYDLWLRVSVQEPIPLIPVPLVIKRGGHADQLSRSMWGMDRYRVLALQKLLRAGLVDSRRAAVLSVLRRKVAVLSNGARKRGKLHEAAEFEAMFAEFESGRPSVDERDSRLRQGQGL
jgi:GT2 family glycosyltransferase